MSSPIIKNVEILKQAKRILQEEGWTTDYYRHRNSEISTAGSQPVIVSMEQFTRQK